MYRQFSILYFDGAYLGVSYCFFDRKHQSFYAPRIAVTNRYKVTVYSLCSKSVQRRHKRYFIVQRRMTYTHQRRHQPFVAPYFFGVFICFVNESGELHMVPVHLWHITLLPRLDSRQPLHNC